MNVLAIIGARLNSSRLPGKHLLDLSGKPLIERLLDRLKTCHQINNIVLATTNDNYNQPLISWSEGKLDCVAFEGDVNDLMARVDNVVNIYQPEVIVYLCGDCPLIAPDYIDKGISELVQQQTEHLSIDTVELKTSIISIHEGMNIYSRIGWDKLMQESQTADEREHVGYANSQRDFLKCHHITDSSDYSAIKHRISVDTKADYDFMQIIYSRWYEEHPPETIVSLKWFQQLIKDDPSLIAMNDHVIQKKPSKCYHSIALFCHADKRIGIGHLRRCALIAESLQENYGFGTKLHILGKQKQFSWLSGNIAWYEEENTFFDKIMNNKSVVCLFDFHPDFIDTKLLLDNCRFLSGHNKAKLIALDKLSLMLPVVEHLFVPSFYTELSSSKVLHGWDNYLLPSITNSDKINQVLILTGGSDALDFGNYLPELVVDNIPSGWSIVWVQGPYASAPISPKDDTNWSVLKSPNNISSLIAESKLVVSSYGLSLFEAMKNGAVTLLLPVADICNDKELEALRSYECCFIANNSNEICTMINDLSVPSKDALNRAKKGQRLLSKDSGFQILGKLISQLSLR